MGIAGSMTEGMQRRMRRGRAWAFAALLLAPIAGPAKDPLPAGVRVVREVTDVTGAAPAPVKLPHIEESLGAAPIGVRYRYEVDLGDTSPTGMALYWPVLRAHGRIVINGHLLVDESTADDLTTPRSIERIRLFRVPDGYLQAGVNRIELDGTARAYLEISPMWIGPYASLRGERDWNIGAAVIGPAVVAVAIGILGLCVLLLWLRRRQEAMYLYFAFGAVSWSLHTLWSALPYRLMPPPHQLIWWYWLYGFLTAMLVVFCLRFGEWRWPRFERGIWLACVAMPPAMYVLEALPPDRGWFDVACAAWLMGARLIAAVGVVALGRYAWRRRNLEAALLTFAGGVAVAFAIHDWVIDRGAPQDTPILLTPYAGLVFIVVVAWILIDRFVRSIDDLERLNVELESRVEQKSAALGTALIAMEAAKNEAEHANHAKSAFLAAASHDLRQPIHALGLYLATLRAGTLTDAQERLAERMSRSIVALDTMFNALLDISRMDAGAVTPLMRSFELEPLVRRIVDDQAGAAAAKGLRLSLRISGRLDPPNVRSDALLVERIVRNLIGNAIKYTENGGVLVGCRMRAGQARLEVWDTGCGIGADERERVFDEFYQVGNPERLRSAGLGLGLSIVRRLTRLLDLELTMRSEPGRGSCFAFALPSTTAPATPGPDPLSWSSLEGLEVAMIEDDPEVRDAMRALFGQWGCTVIEGADSDEVLAQVDLGDARPRAIVADFRLRGVRNGLQCVAAMHARLGSHIPALIVTGDSSADRIADIQASGLEWMSKPVAVARLRSWLQSTMVHGAPVATQP